MPAKEATVVVVHPMVHPDGEKYLATHCRCVRIVSSDVDEIATALNHADAVIARSPVDLSAELLKGAPSLRVVSASGAGYDYIDMNAATSLGLPVLYAPDVGAGAVSEFVIGAMIAMSRKMLITDAAVRDPELIWSRRTRDLLGVGLEGKTIGILGYGRIGQRVGALARAFDMNVAVIHNSSRQAHVPNYLDVTTHADLETLLSGCDFISVHIPRTASESFSVGAKEIAKMQLGGYLINTSRGGVVDEAAVAAALRAGKLGGAAFDVFADEPKVNLSPLLSAPNVLLSPHIAGLTDVAVQRLALGVARNVVSALDGEFQGLPVVNREALQL